LGPASGNYVLEAKTTSNPTWRDASTVLGVGDGAGYVGAYVPDECLNGLQMRLTLGRNARVSHVEIVVRSEPLVHLQLPQLQQAASQELVAPFIVEEFEVDPTIGALERGTLFEVPGVSGRLGSVWIVTDVTVKQTAAGQIFGVIGNVRNAQPTDVVSAALLDDSNIGIVDGGVASRGLEATESGQPSGLDNQSDETQAAALRGTAKRAGGGTSNNMPYIVLSKGVGAEDEP
jgi:hypothetical protein